MRIKIGKMMSIIMLKKTGSWMKIMTMEWIREMNVWELVRMSGY
tara:strand:+ start:521 stop:652 length:132 start_codon:yes stop_codon:yes gene_type:complete